MKYITDIIILIFIVMVFVFLVVAYDYYIGTVAFKDYKPYSNNNYYTTNSLKLSNHLPVVDSSIALYPVSASLIQNVYDKKYYKDQLHVVSTSQTFMDLAIGAVDAIIVTMPNQINEAVLNGSERNIKMVPIAKEALVFYVNKANNINSLTIEEINKIYIGTISDWKEVGGKEKSIKTFQLGKHVGGSEACFSTIVNQNEIDYKTHFIAYDMKDIINNVVWNKNAIGYAFNSFYSKLFKKNSLKAVKINDISPTKENIISGQYPLLFDVYFMYDEDNDNENIVKILDWFLSDDGQQVIKEAGLMPINDRGES